MTNQVPSPQREGQSPDLRKLHKREQRLLERLQKAQQAQARALERFQRAQVRLQKRMTRVQRVEGRLTLVRQQLHELSVSPGAAAQFIAPEPSPASEKPIASGSPTVGAQPGASEMIAPEPGAPETPEEEDITGRIQHAAANQPDRSLSPAEAARLVEEARAAAEAAEESARLAAERAVDVAARLEQIGSGRHLEQELLQLQVEAERASAMAQEAERAVREAEMLAAGTKTPLEEPGEVPQAGLPGGDETLREAPRSTVPEEIGEVSQVEQADGVQEEASGSSSPGEAGKSIKEVELVEEELPTIQNQAAPEPEAIDRIEEEEEFVEAVAAVTVAHVAAERAAEAEAFAEVSSAQTREARRQAREADRALEEVRAGIRRGALSGEEAEKALSRAEEEVTRAQAFLADAEAAEEQALKAAMNAEAEAEVAEGRAYAASEQAGMEPIAQEEEGQPLQASPTAPAAEHAQGEVSDDEQDITQKIPTVRPQETP